jgi:nitric oxide reductase subunit B
MNGQNVYQRYGLMDQGAVWGHGTQRGPEFSALSLHILAEAVGDYHASRDYGKPYAALDGLGRGYASAGEGLFLYQQLAAG